LLNPAPGHIAIRGGGGLEVIAAQIGTSPVKMVSNHPSCRNSFSLGPFVRKRRDISSVKKHVKIDRAHLTGLLCLIFVSCLPAFGQTVSLELRTKTGRAEFHVGEVILVDLLFVADTPTAYERNRGISFPESYPMPDTFSAEPREGWADPLGEYRKALFSAEHSGHFPIAVSSFSAKHVLGPEPYALSLILNDYIRFSRPGHYVLQVEDTGVIHTTTRLGLMPEHLTLKSNRLELTILPADSEWQQNKLRETLETFAQLQEVIDSHARSYRASLSDSCISLRALGIPGAGTTMVDALRNENLFSRCSFQTGILEFPDPKFILVQLRKRLADPGFPVTYAFFNTMAMISLLAEGHADQLFGPNEEKVDRRLEQQLLSVVPLKRGEAKTDTISTLVKMCFAAYGSDMGEFANVPKQPSRLNTQVLQVAAANFEQLSPGVQRIVNNYRKAHGLQITDP
jgi:hypothetical protein